MRLRLLPLVMVFASLALAAKVGGVWQNFLPSTPALAAEKTAAPQSAAAMEDEGLPEPSKDQTAAIDPEDMGDGDMAEAAVASDTPVPASQKSPLAADPLTLTDEEIELLQSLAQRREELEQRAKDIDQREVMLAAAEGRIEEKIQELEALRATIESLLEEHGEQEEAQLESLVKIYESMKPKDAARIFEELDMTVLLDVIERMKERKSAPILAKMDPVRAKAITLQLAQRRDLPIPKE